MTELEYLIFLGCAIPYRVSAYEISTRKVADKLGIKLVEMPEYNCCGLPMDPLSHDVMLTLAARNLCVAEKQGLNIMTLCAGCAGTLRKVNKKLKDDKKTRDLVNGYLKETGLEFKGTIDVKHLIQVLAEDVGIKRIKEAIQRPLTKLKVAEHSGCHVLRPEKYMGFDEADDPAILKALIEATGAQCIEYADKTECCGAMIVGVNENIPLQLTRDKLKNVNDAGAKALVTVCPYCHIMYDINQSRIERMFNEKIGMPILHYPQLLGLALGFRPDELGLKELRVDPSTILDLI